MDGSLIDDLLSTHIEEGVVRSKGVGKERKKKEKEEKGEENISTKTVKGSADKLDDPLDD